VSFACKIMPFSPMTALSVMPARIISTTIVTSHTLYTVFSSYFFPKRLHNINRQMVVVFPFACLLLFIYFCRILSFLLFLPVFCLCFHFMVYSVWVIFTPLIGRCIHQQLLCWSTVTTVDKLHLLSAV